MNKIILNISLFIIAFLIVSCNSTTSNVNQIQKKDTENKTEQTESAINYSGTYSCDDNECIMSVTLTKSGQEYACIFKINGKEYQGTASPGIVDNKCYIDFKVNIENENLEIPSVLENNVITIQNYGNAMNQYHYIKSCDKKFIDLRKK